jgi:transposase
VRGVIAQVTDRPGVVLVDLPVFGRAARLVWHKRRWRCADPDCAKSNCTEEETRIAASRMAFTDRAGRCLGRP